jgi:hypothetical protein
MRAFSAQELAGMEATQEGAMMDTCLHLQRFTEADDYNNPTSTYIAGASYPCGLDEAPRDREAMDGTQVVMMDAKLRMSIDVDGEISNADRLRLTHRFGVALATPRDYEIIGAPRRGPSGLVFALRKVTDGS